MAANAELLSAEETDHPWAPLANRLFRALWIASIASNIGTWMQNVALGALAFQLTHSATFGRK